MAMLSGVRVGHTTGIAEAIMHLAATSMAATLKPMEAEIRTEVEGIISEEFDTGRTGHRHKAEQRHLKGSIVVHVDTNGNRFPMSITVRSSADPHHVGALEFGSPAHKIRPRNVEWLRFPVSVGAQGKSVWVKTKEVRHPGVKKPYRFMRRGLSQVIERRLPGTVVRWIP